MFQLECCICRSWKEKSGNNWHYPSRDERKLYHFREGVKISHGYCPECYVTEVELEGIPKRETSRIIKLVEEWEFNGKPKSDD